MSERATSQEQLCPRCRQPAKSSDRFCGRCGWELSRHYTPLRVTPKSVAAVLGVGLAIWGFGVWVSKELGGEPPTQTFAEHQAKQGLSQGSHAQPQRDLTALTLDQLRTEVSRIEIEAGGQSGEMPPGKAMELVTYLQEILRRQPDDPDALLGMANVAFAQRVFDKSAVYYERFLVKFPEDFAVRGRYASTLTFLGETDRAVAELERVIQAQPEDFHARAYLSIALFDKGDWTRAFEEGNRALALAPHEEARARFAEFLKQQESAAAGSSAPAGADSTNADPQTAAVNSSADDGLDPLRDQLKGSPIAGTKFVRLEREGDVAKAFFRDFPMAAMPPFAKDKFMAGIKEKLPAETGITTVKFIDAPSGSVLDEVKVR